MHQDVVGAAESIRRIACRVLDLASRAFDNLITVPVFSIDEVGDLSPDAQAKLLRFLEDGEFYRVGIGLAHDQCVMNDWYSSMQRRCKAMFAFGPVPSKRPKRNLQSRLAKLGDCWRRDSRPDG